MRPVAVVVGLLCVRRAWSQVDGGTRVLRPTLAGGLSGPPPWPHQHGVCHAFARATANGACARGHHRRPAGIRGGLPSRRPRWLWGRGFGCAIAGPFRGCPGDGRPKLALTRSCEASLGGRPRARAGERIPGPPARAPIEAGTLECRSRAANGRSIAWLPASSTRDGYQNNLPTFISVSTPSTAKIAAAMPCTSVIDTFFATTSPSSTAGTLAIIMPSVVPATTLTKSL